MTQTAITVAGPEWNTIPRTIQQLIIQATEIGGEVTQPVPRRFEFALPCRFVGGNTRLVNRTAVGYYVSDGKNIIRGAHETRQEIAYWANQANR